MKNIIKLFLVSLAVVFAIVSCNNDADRDWTTQEASFKLYDTSLASENILYETMKTNPFVLSWESIGSGEYSVVLSSKADFSNKTQLGTSTDNKYVTTIGDLNTKLLQLGFSPYVSQKVYLRIEKGTDVSNTISFNAKVYPTKEPSITAPTNGSTITLNSADQTATATTITWSDYSTYGSPVTYTVEIAKRGSTTFSQLGVVTDLKSLAISSKDLNTAALNVGGTVNEEGEFDFRVKAKTSFSTPAIELKSAIVTAKMKPYQVDYPDFFLVGAASAIGWDAPKSQKLYKNDNTSEIYTFLQPDEFRFLGQADWNPVNYSMNTDGIRPTYRYFKSVSSNIERAGGDAANNNIENMKFTGTAGIYHVVINADFGVKSLTVTPTTSVWDIPNLYLAGSIQGWNASSALPFQPKGNGVFESDPLELPNGAEFKFLGQQDWSGKEWGNIRKDNVGNSGLLGPNGANGNIKFDGGGNFYTITVDLKRGTYKIVKLL